MDGARGAQRLDRGAGRDDLGVEKVLAREEDLEPIIDGIHHPNSDRDESLHRQLVPVVLELVVHESEVGAHRNGAVPGAADHALMERDLRKPQSRLLHLGA